MNALFALLHIGHRSSLDAEYILLDFLFVSGAGLYFGSVAVWTRTLVGVTLAHSMANVMVFIVMPLL